MKTALLLSGGIDSTSLLYWKRPDLAITIDYGQVCASAELRTSRHLCRILDIAHQEIKVDCGQLGSGDLANTEPTEIAPVPEWWPFRNQLLITLCVMKAVGFGIEKIYIGSVKSDSCHSDGTADFVNLIDSLVSYQEGGIQVCAPSIDITTVELVQQSGIQRDLLCWAHSCHRSNYACGLCRGCNKHREVMDTLGYGAY